MLHGATYHKGEEKMDMSSKKIGSWVEKPLDNAMDIINDVTRRRDLLQLVVAILGTRTNHHALDEVSIVDSAERLLNEIDKRLEK